VVSNKFDPIRDNVLMVYIIDIDQTRYALNDYISFAGYGSGRFYGITFYKSTIICSIMMY